ncbi:unnamed protein product, partial [Nesidiocoris tenuis]
MTKRSGVDHLPHSFERNSLRLINISLVSPVSIFERTEVTTRQVDSFLEKDTTMMYLILGFALASMASAAEKPVFGARFARAPQYVASSAPLSPVRQPIAILSQNSNSNYDGNFNYDLYEQLHIKSIYFVGTRQWSECSCRTLDQQRIILFQKRHEDDHNTSIYSEDGITDASKGRSISIRLLFLLFVNVLLFVFSFLLIDNVNAIFANLPIDWDRLQRSQNMIKLCEN